MVDCGVFVYKIIILCCSALFFYQAWSTDNPAKPYRSDGYMKYPGRFPDVLIGAGAVAYLMGIEKYILKLFLVESETTLPINLYLQVFYGSGPVVNMVSLLLIIPASMLFLP